MYDNDDLDSIALAFSESVEDDDMTASERRDYGRQKIRAASRHIVDHDFDSLFDDREED